MSASRRVPPLGNVRRCSCSQASQDRFLISERHGSDRNRDVLTQSSPALIFECWQAGIARGHGVRWQVNHADAGPPDRCARALFVQRRQSLPLLDQQLQRRQQSGNLPPVLPTQTKQTVNEPQLDVSRGEPTCSWRVTDATRGRYAMSKASRFSGFGKLLTFKARLDFFAIELLDAADEFSATMVALHPARVSRSRSRVIPACEFDGV